VKKGFHLELAANEPQVRSPIAASFDERGRMFVCEMIDYSEMRDVTPHLGRISVLETRTAMATMNEQGLRGRSRMAHGRHLRKRRHLRHRHAGHLLLQGHGRRRQGGRARVVFTGSAPACSFSNVQGLANCPQWGMDNRIHIQCGGGNRGKMKCLKRPDLPEVELGGRDLWFDPRTFDFGLEPAARSMA